MYIGNVDDKAYAYRYYMGRSTTSFERSLYLEVPLLFTIRQAYP